MPPFSKTNRSPIACTECRKKKVRCIRGDLVCLRCTSNGIECSYELKVSQRVGNIKKKISSLIPELESKETTTKNPKHRTPNVKRYKPSSASIDYLEATIDTPIFPSKEDVLEIVEVFFTNQYHGIFPFLHYPSIKKFLQSSRFDPETYIEDYKKSLIPNFASSIMFPDPVLLLSILALCARLHPRTASRYGNFQESNPHSFKISEKSSSLSNTPPKGSNASKYFGWHARQQLKEVFDRPTVQRIQALCLLSSHEWGEGNNSRSFLYVGIAARMALVLGLGSEDTIVLEEDGEMKYIVAESKRRTIWSVYLMDKCNGSGRERVPAIRVEDIKVKLPSEENDFLFGNPEPVMEFRQLYDFMLKYNEDTTEFKSLQKMPLIGFTIVLFDIWSKIAKWVGEIGSKHETQDPWSPESFFHEISRDLDSVLRVLPKKYQYNDYNLRVHIELGTAAHFGYFHCLWYLCRIFLNREYLFRDHLLCPDNWWKNNIHELLNSLENMTVLILKLKDDAMVVVAPFTGFEIYTNAITLLHFCSFSNDTLLSNLVDPNLDSATQSEAIEAMKAKYKTLAVINIENLQPWTNSWEMGRKWYEMSLRLGVSFGQLAGEGVEESEVISDDLRHSMHDYGTGKVSEDYSHFNKAEVKIIEEVPHKASDVDVPSDIFSPSMIIYPGYDNFDLSL